MLQHQQSSTLTVASSVSGAPGTEHDNLSAASQQIDQYSTLSGFQQHNSNGDQLCRGQHYHQDQNERHQQLRQCQGGGISLSSSSSSNSSNSYCLNEQQQQQNGRASSEIFEEIQRFESVHPCIYALYNLIETVPDLTLQEHLREQVIRIEDAFVNSEEWTLSRAVQELKLGVVGSLDSGKTSFVHFFLTERLTAEESPEGGRFKKEVALDGRSYLLLIRDEGCNPPEFQFTHWIDGVIIVFSVECRESYLIALQYFKKMTAYRNLNDIPVFLVGILDSISGDEMPNREVSLEEARMASLTMKMSNYFECYTFKSNVHDIFNSACKKLLQQHRRHYRSALSNSCTLNNTTNCSSNNNFGSSCHNSSSAGRTSSAQDTHIFANNSARYGSSRGNNCHHQRSISALPAQDHTQASQYCLNGSPTLPAHQPPVPPLLGSTRNAGSSAVLRRSHQVSQQQPCYYQQQSPLPSQRPVISGILANVLPSCTSSASTFYQDLSVVELPRSDSLVLGSGAQVDQTLPQFRRENAFGRDSGRFFSSFMPASNIHAYGIERISTPDFVSSNAAISSSAASGMSPAYSHNNLASQFAYTNATTVPSQYSRSSSSVVSNANSQYHQHMYHHNYHDFSGAPGTSNNSGAGGFMSSTALLNNAAALSATGVSASLILPTPSSTPNTQRKNRRISNIFRGNKDHHNSQHLSQAAEEHHHLSSLKHQLQQHQGLAESVGMGIGREIPIKEGILYKKSHRGLNREWKKKYVCLYADGRIRYHPTHKDYRNNTDAKEIKSLLTSTVRVSGRQRPRATNRNSLLPMQQNLQQQSNLCSKELATQDESLLESGGASTPGEGNSDGGGGELNLNAALITSTSSDFLIGQLHHQDLPSTTADAEKCLPTKLPVTNISAAVEAKKKRSHKLLGSGTKKDDEEEDMEFEIISSNQKRWEFSASSTEERDEWVHLIEEMIERCIQSQQSQKQQQNSQGHGDRAEVQALRKVPGNDLCADCAQPRPDWASLNLGTLICIECSGIHRNLGSHISRVRSLDLDDWPTEYIMVMQSIGNKLANSIWEKSAPLSEKPAPDNSREIKEAWIKMKYEQKLYLPVLDLRKTVFLQLIDAVLARDLKVLLSVLPHSTQKDINQTIGSRTENGKNSGSSEDGRTAIHLACSIGAAEILQLLIWHNADVHALDEALRSALWYARLNGSQDCEKILYNAGLSMEYGTSDENKNRSSSDVKEKTSEFSASDFNSSIIGTSAGIAGTMNSVGYLSTAAADTARLRRQSDLMMRKNALNQNLSPNDLQSRLSMQSPTTNNKLTGETSVSKRNSDATNSFQNMPASII